MRRWFCALALVAAAGLARAEDTPRMVPTVGAKLTYRLISGVTKTPSATIKFGLVYTYIVTSSDGTTAEGIIKPTAKIMECTQANDLVCGDSEKTPGAHYDEGMLTVPIASDSGDGLAKHSYFKLVHFLLVSRKFPFPSSRDPKDYNFRDFGPDPDYVLTNTQQCDNAGLDGFLPFGKSPKITLNCETTFEQSASRDGRPPNAGNNTVAMEISYAGDGWVTLPSGNWQVQKLTIKITPKDPSDPANQSEVLFSPQLGATVRSHTTGTNPHTQSTIENTVELISVAP